MSDKTIKAVIVGADGKRVDVEIPGNKPVGVIIRQDTRLQPAVRCFKYFRKNENGRYLHEFHEVNAIFLNPEGI